MKLRIMGILPKRINLLIAMHVTELGMLRIPVSGIELNEYQSSFY